MCSTIHVCYRKTVTPSLPQFWWTWSMRTHYSASDGSKSVLRSITHWVKGLYNKHYYLSSDGLIHSCQPLARKQSNQWGWGVAVPPKASVYQILPHSDSGLSSMKCWCHISRLYRTCNPPCPVTHWRTALTLNSKAVPFLKHIIDSAVFCCSKSLTRATYIWWEKRPKSFWLHCKSAVLQCIHNRLRHIHWHLCFLRPAVWILMSH